MLIQRYYNDIADINEGLKIMHNTIKILIDNPRTEDRYFFGRM